MSASAAVVAVVFGCLDATQIQIAVGADDGICTARARYYVRVVDTPAALESPPEEVNAGVPFPECRGSAGGATALGELTVLPSTSDDRSKRIAVEVTIGVDGQDPTVCGLRTSEGNPRCYVARRRLAFVPHTALRVATYFDQRCAGRACDPASTCFRGSCVDAEATCEGSDCLTAAERAGGAGFDPNAPNGGDAGSDAPTTNDASVDPSDAIADVSPSDARTDARPPDSGACTTLAGGAALATSKTKCALVPGSPTTCCVNSSTFATATTPGGCTGDETERLCQTSCDCPSGADCIDVVSAASGGYQGPRAACVQRGCAGLSGGWGREGALGNACAADACCEASANLRCDTNTNACAPR